MPTRHIEAAPTKWKRPSVCNTNSVKALFKELSAATNEYVAAVDAFLARKRTEIIHHS